MVEKRILEENKIYYLKNGTQVFISPNPPEWECDTIMISRGPKNGVGSTIHINVNPPDPYDKIQEIPINCEITYYDNWTIKVSGSRKENPTFILEDDEFPSQLLLRLKENSMKVYKEKISKESVI